MGWENRDLQVEARARAPYRHSSAALRPRVDPNREREVALDHDRDPNQRHGLRRGLQEF